jgi:hypothetical protein
LQTPDDRWLNKGQRQRGGDKLDGARSDATETARIGVDSLVKVPQPKR